MSIVGAIFSVRIQRGNGQSRAIWRTGRVIRILADLCFGKSMEITEPGENHLKAMPSFLASSIIRLSRIWLKLGGVDSLFDALLPNDVKTFNERIMTSVAARTKLEDEIQKQGSDQKIARKDMLHYLFQAKDPEISLPAFIPDRLFQEGGSDTTTTTLAATFFLSNPQPARLCPAHSRDSQDLLNYEAMRMSSPVPADPGREALPGGMGVDGMLVSKGTESLKSPQAFIPFTTTKASFQIRSSTAPTAGSWTRKAACRPSLPFPLVLDCVSKNLAYLEISIIMVRLLFLLEVKATDGTP
ncbi:hypothetical protein MMC29_000903 [Sticta canariensis]|nr:hypothetical protein [Sticta canariensis]